MSLNFDQYLNFQTRPPAPGEYDCSGKISINALADSVSWNPRNFGDTEHTVEQIVLREPDCEFYLQVMLFGAAWRWLISSVNIASETKFVYTKMRDRNVHRLEWMIRRSWVWDNGQAEGIEIKVKSE